MTINTNEQNILMEALKETRKEYEKYSNKVSSKLCKEIKDNSSLIEYFKGLTLDELKEIRKFWGFQGISSLKKDELTTVLKDKILESISDILEYFDEERFKILLHLSEEGYIEYDNLSLINIAYFRKMGIVFSGILDNKKVLVLPKEISSIVSKWNEDKKVRDKICINDKIIKATKGIIYYYGVVRENQLFNVFKGISNVDIDYERYTRIIMNRYAYNIDFNIGEELVYHKEVKNPKNVIDEQNKNEDITFIYLSEEEAILAGENSFKEEVKEEKELLSLIMSNYKIFENDAIEIVDECFWSIKNDAEVMDLMKVLEESFVISDMNIYKKFIKSIANLQENTKVWSLKGNTINETKLARENKVNVAKNIGRNDPCTCGSGKKYKKCCGKK